MKAALLLPALLFGCATDADDSTLDQPDDAEALSTSSSELSVCIRPPAPPPPNATWTIGTSTQATTISNYGVGDCDAYVLAVRNTDTISVSAADAPVTASACIGTELTVQKYRNSGSTWAYAGTASSAGVWTYTGCRVPHVNYDANTQSETRVRIQARRTTCSGNLCGTQRGLAMTVSATPFHPVVPN